jgi:hypothetical protein
MNRIFRTTLVCALSTLTWSLDRTASAETDGRAPNAALHYWRGFAAMPSIDAQSEDSKLVASWDSAPIDSRVEQLLARCRPSLDLLVRSTSIRECDWGLTIIEDGPSLLVPHLPEARNASALLCLRARSELAAGNTAAAMDDLIGTLILSRHLAAGDSTIISALVSHSIETRAVETLAKRLSRFDVVALRDLSRRLGQLPARAALDKLLKGEEEALVDWLRRKIRAGIADGHGDATAKELSSALLWNDAEGKTLLAGARSSPEQILQDLDATSAFLVKLAPFIKAPPAEFSAKSAELLGQADAANAWVHLLAPGITRLRGTRAETVARFALLEAAVAIQLDGPEALTKQKDPVTGSPIERISLERGYELRAPEVPGQPAVSLKVGTEP